MYSISFDFKGLFPKYEDDINGSLNCLLKSIYCVESKYLVYTDNEGNIIDGLERVFAYELYRQWANNIEKDTVLRNYTINGEMHKNINPFYKDLDKNIFPDMVMHSGNGDTNMQEIICEIKRQKGVDCYSFMKDITKLWHFTSFEIPFRFGVFILVGTDLEWLAKEICPLIERNCYFLEKFDEKKTNSIICVSYNIDIYSEKKQMEVCRLPELIELSKLLHRKANKLTL